MSTVSRETRSGAKAAAKHLPPMTRYRAHKMSDRKPEPVTITRATEHCVWINGRRYARKSEWDAIFPTELEAWQWLQRDAFRRIEHYETALERERERAAALTAGRERAERDTGAPQPDAAATTR